MLGLAVTLSVRAERGRILNNVFFITSKSSQTYPSRCFSNLQRCPLYLKNVGITNLRLIPILGYKLRYGSFYFFK